MATIVPADASERTAWLARLDIDRKVKSELLNAILSNDSKKALSLLDGSDYDAKDLRSKDFKNLPTGLTALHLSALFGDDAIVTSLLEKKASPKITCYCQITSYSVSTKFWMDARPLLFAVGAKHEGIVGQLLKAGAPVSIDDAWPLYSSEWRQLTSRFDWHVAMAILRMLINAGLNINHRTTKIKWTLLHYVVNLEPRSDADVEDFLRARYDTASLLLSNGADPLLKDHFGRTVYGLLEERGQTAKQKAIAGEFQQMKIEADEQLQELLQDAMQKRLNEIKHAGGLKGTVQRLARAGESGDRLPLLLRSGASSLRRITLGRPTPDTFDYGASAA